MSEIDTKGEFNTKLRDETFLQFADKSTMGVTIIRRGFLLYFNKKFEEIFGYTTDDVSDWKKFEYFKIIHPDDIPLLLQKIKVEDNKNAILHFRGVRKNGEFIPIENYIYRGKYNNKYAYISSYTIVKRPLDEEDIPKLIKTKEGKFIVVDYNPDIVKTLEENNLKFKIINHCSYREED